MSKRTTDDRVKHEDLLREEYFDLLPVVRSVAWELETEIRHRTLPIQQHLKSHEQLIVKSRIKECESAIRTLRGSSHGGVFDPDRTYSMLQLPDLAGVRVLVFPNNRLNEVDSVLRDFLPGWTSKPVKDGNGNPQAPKYYGCFDHLSTSVRAEYQVVPMLLGLFWEVEHSAMYKFPIARNSGKMQGRRAGVEAALAQFEAGIASLLPDDSQPE